MAQHMCMCLHTLHPAASTTKLSSVTFSSRLEGTTTSLHLLPSINAWGPSLATCSDHTFCPLHPQQPPFLKGVLFFPRPSAFLSVAAATEGKRESHPLPTLHSMNGLGKTPEAVQGWWDGQGWWVDSGLLPSTLSYVCGPSREMAGPQTYMHSIQQNRNPTARL